MRIARRAIRKFHLRRIRGLTDLHRKFAHMPLSGVVVFYLAGHHEHYDERIGQLHKN